jgi:hypothetical protein
LTPNDNTRPTSPPGSEEGAGGAAPLPPKRSGSQKRQRNKFWIIALTPEEEASALESAQRVGLSRSSYGRAALLGTPGPRAQRTPPVNAEVLARATAALNKLGSNVNTIARALNAGGAFGMGHEHVALLAEIRVVLRDIREAVGRRDRDDSQRKQA